MFHLVWGRDEEDVPLGGERDEEDVPLSGGKGRGRCSIWWGGGERRCSVNFVTSPLNLTHSFRLIKVLMEISHAVFRQSFGLLNI